MREKAIMANTELSQGLRPRVSCPVCQSENARKLFTVESKVFVRSNPTINQRALADSGLLDLPSIDLVQCSHCTLVFTEKVLSGENETRFWNEVYMAEASRAKILGVAKRRNNLQRWNQLYGYILDHYVEDGETVNVLDVGCGWGDFLHMAGGAGVRVIGVEPNEEKARFARSNGVEVYCTMEDIPGDITFKVFHADQVLEHLENPVAVMRAVIPRLHDQFVGYISVPNYHHRKLASIKNRLDREEWFEDKDLITWDHLSYFSPESLCYMIKGLGLEAINPATNRRIRKLASTSTYVRFTDQNRDGRRRDDGSRSSDGSHRLFHSRHF